MRKIRLGVDRAGVAGKPEFGYAAVYLVVGAPAHHVGNPDVLNVTAQGHIIHQDVFGPTTFINPLVIVEVVREAEATGT